MVLLAPELFHSTSEWRQHDREVLKEVTCFYLLLYQEAADHGCRTQWLEVSRRGMPAFCFTSARRVVPISSFVPSGNPDPSLVWQVLDPQGRRIVPYRFSDEDLDRTLARFAERQRRRDLWLQRGAPVRRARGSR
jgi:hypothetical protein